MIIKLIPPLSTGVPVVLFSFTYNPEPYTNPTSSPLPLPTAYENQLSLLRQHKLPLPSSIHMLDKSVWIAASIHEVLFDLARYEQDPTAPWGVKVSCTFVDGDVQEWSFCSEKCVRELVGVLKDVDWSSVQERRERIQRSASEGASPYEQELSIPPPPEQTRKKHKKQKSLLMTLVSLVSPTISNRGSSTASAFSRTPPPSPSTPTPTPLPPAPPPEYNFSASLLRRRARAALVDAFRRYVYDHFALVNSHYSSSQNTSLSSSQNVLWESSESGFGYVTWLVRSKLRECEKEIEVLVREAGLGCDPPRVVTSGRFLTDSPFLPEEDDEDGDEEATLDGTSTSTSTDTDGSSVHTPTDHSPLPVPLPPIPQRSRARPVQSLPRSPSPPSPPPSLSPSHTPPHPNSHLQSQPHPQSHTHTQPTLRTLHHLQTLQTTHTNLLNLLSSLHTAKITNSSEQEQALAILEVKARRKAWSNRALMGGARVTDVGFGMPERGSGLARTVICASDLQAKGEEEGFDMSFDHNGSYRYANSYEYEYEMEMGVMDVDVEMEIEGLERKFRGLGLGLDVGGTKKRRNVSMLFPVSEEDEDEEVDEDEDEEVFGGSDRGVGGLGGRDGEGGMYALSSIAGSSSTSTSTSLSITSTGWRTEEGTVCEVTEQVSSIRLVEDAENGFLQPLELPLTPPLSPSSSMSTSSLSSSAGSLPTTPILTTPTPILATTPTKAISPRPRKQSMFIPSPASPHPISTSTLSSSSTSSLSLSLSLERPPTPPSKSLEPRTKIEIFDVSYESDDEVEVEGMNGVSRRSFEAVGVAGVDTIGATYTSTSTTTTTSASNEGSGSVYGSLGSGNCSGILTDLDMNMNMNVNMSVSTPGEEEEFTLSMDVPSSSSNDINGDQYYRHSYPRKPRFEYSAHTQRAMAFGYQGRRHLPTSSLNPHSEFMDVDVDVKGKEVGMGVEGWVEGLTVGEVEVGVGLAPNDPARCS
ncbi:hypothetical protein K474DRAFT_1709998 [Panus rudis PR-1116 ss-1]|nr:hypothetical protein K474DRAFT_1709998 [Panus rudis PR-1116 ss-1]